MLCLVALSLALASNGQDGKEAPPALDVGAAIERSVDLLVELQENLADRAEEAAPREWPYEGVYREGGRIPIGYRVGGTAIVAWALLESPAYAGSSKVRDAVGRALDFVLESLEDDRMSADFSGSYDVRGWGHAYALNLLLRMRALHRVPDPERERVDRSVRELVHALEATEIPGGGWNYSRASGGKEPAPASPFMTAPTLLALFEAKAQGEAVDARLVDRALDALEGCRTKEGAVPYTTAGGRDEWPGAIGRSAITEATLLLAGKSSVENVRRALERFFEHWEWLEKRRKQQGTHVPPYGIAPYYVFYAHGYAGLAIELLPETERPKYRALLRERLAEVREPDGGWNDRVFPRSENYGTAMALLALLAPELPRPAAWSESESAGAKKE